MMLKSSAFLVCARTRLGPVLAPLMPTRALAFRLPAPIVRTFTPVTSMVPAILLLASSLGRAGSRALVVNLRAGTENGALPPRPEN
jgi:hypothetical protein